MFRRLLFLLLFSSQALAMPPRPGQLPGQKGDGVVNVKVRRIEAVRPTSSTAPPPSVALSGKHQLLVILVESEDTPWPSEWSVERYQKLLFSKQGMSMREFYRENSYGAYELNGAVVGPVRVSGSMNSYAYSMTDPKADNVHRLIAQAIAGASKKVDLSKFDTHDTRGRAGKDGILDHVMFLYAEKSGRFDGFAPIWPHRGTLEQDVGKGLRLASYTILNHAARLGVYVHEFGHDLGIPDLYDRDYTSYGAGDWCTMASGSWAGEAERPVHISAWAKARVGWIQPVVISKGVQHLELQASSERPFALKIPLGEVDSTEYLLLENRRKVGFDAALPGEGLLVWHIDEAKGDNDTEDHKLVDVVEATKLQDLDKIVQGSYPNYGPDLFVAGGKDELSDDTNPSTRTNDGDKTGVRIKVLTPAQRVMAVDIQRPEIFNPGGIPFVLQKDGYNYGRFAVVPLGSGSEALMPLEATPGDFLAFNAEAFVQGNPGRQAVLTFRLYADGRGKPGKVMVEQDAKITIPQEGFGWARAKLGQGETAPRLSANKTYWVGVTSDGAAYPALNPFSRSKEARFRNKQSEAKLRDSFNFRDTGVTPVDDYVIRLSGFGYLRGTERPEPLANDADPLVIALRKADQQAEAGRYEAAIAEYERVLAAMEQDSRRYENWIPVAVNAIGVAAYELKRYDVALERFEATLRRAVAAEDEPIIADVHENLAETAFYARKLELAVEHLVQSEALNRKLSRLDRLVENLYWRARALQEQKQPEPARELLLEVQELVPQAFPKDAKEEAEWTKRVQQALAGKPEDKPQVKERGNEVTEDQKGKKQKKVYTDLLQFLSEDTEEN